MYYLVSYVDAHCQCQANPEQYCKYLNFIYEQDFDKVKLRIVDLITRNAYLRDEVQTDIKEWDDFRVVGMAEEQDLATIGSLAETGQDFSHLITPMDPTAVRVLEDYLRSMLILSWEQISVYNQLHAESFVAKLAEAPQC